MVLLRKVIGDVLRARRLAQHRTLREVSTAANVSLGYLSEIERGHKEASSELLGSICEALGTGLSDVLSDVAATFALAEQMDEMVSPVGQPADAGEPVASSATVTDSITDGHVTVQVHSDGPLRTRLQARLSGPGTPGPRQSERIYAS